MIIFTKFHEDLAKNEVFLLLVNFLTWSQFFDPDFTYFLAHFLTLSQNTYLAVWCSLWGLKTELKDFLDLLKSFLGLTANSTKLSSISSTYLLPLEREAKTIHAQKHKNWSFIHRHSLIHQFSFHSPFCRLKYEQ